MEFGSANVLMCSKLELMCSKLELMCTAYFGLSSDLLSLQLLRSKLELTCTAVAFSDYYFTTALVFSYCVVNLS